MPSRPPAWRTGLADVAVIIGALTRGRAYRPNWTPEPGRRPGSASTTPLPRGSGRGHPDQPARCQPAAPGISLSRHRDDDPG
jgi:hypothetical protein